MFGKDICPRQPPARLTQPDTTDPTAPPLPQQGFHTAIHISPFRRYISEISKADVPNPHSYSLENAGCHMERALLALARDLCAEGRATFNSHQRHQTNFLLTNRRPFPRGVRAAVTRTCSASLRALPSHPPRLMKMQRWLSGKKATFPTSLR